MFSRIILCFSLLTFLATPVFSAQVGSVTKFAGDVYFRAKNNTPYQQIKSSMAIFEGGWIKTGKNGWIQFDLIDKSRFIIANNSELELASFILNKKNKDGQFTLTYGKLKASVVPSPGLTSSIRFKNKTVVAGVKGTEFLMLSEGPANVFFGNDGRVTISGHDSIEKTLLPQYMTQTTRGYTPIDPVSIEPNTPLADAKAAFDFITRSEPPADWLASDNLPFIIARWNIGYGHYLADAGKYEEALQVFQIALDLGKNAEIRSDARLERGAVYSRFLGNSEAALAENLLILEEYPHAAQAELALFNAGQILFDLSFKDKARERFNEYMQKYPNGRHKNNVETLLGVLK